MAKSKITKKRGYISKFLKTADKALGTGMKTADLAVQEGIKRADEALDTGIELGIISTKQARIEAKKLRAKAEKEVSVFQKQAEKEAAKIKKDSERKIKNKIMKLKKSTSRTENLKLLEKLAKLQKTGIITKREFQTKKKELLRNI